MIQNMAKKKYNYTYTYVSKADKAKIAVASSDKKKKIIRLFLGLGIGGVFGYVVYENWNTVTGAFNNLMNTFTSNLSPSASASPIPLGASSTLGGMTSTQSIYAGTAQADSSFLTFAQSQGWYPYVSTYSLQYNVPATVILAVIEQESGGNPNIVSSDNAIGLMQILPSTAAQVASANGIPYMSSSSLYNPQINIAIGTAYLASLYSQYQNWTTALNAYFAGGGNINNISQITVNTSGMPSGSSYGQQVMLRADNLTADISSSGSLLNYLNQGAVA